jgi:hypothetical protein
VRAAGIVPHDLKHGKVKEEILSNLSLFWIVVLDEISLDCKVSEFQGISGQPLFVGRCYDYLH